MALLISGAVIVLVLALQLWRSFRLEAQLHATESERASLLGERILQRAATSLATLQQAPPETRFQVRGDQVVVDDSVAWLAPFDREVDRDLIVQGRLGRAERAEFVDQAGSVAAAEFDQLLAGPLLSAQRLQVLSAALWQSHRARLAARCELLQVQFAKHLANVTPKQLASEVVASAVASAVRFAAATGVALLREEAASQLLPCLPALQFAGLPVTASHLAEQHQVVLARRARLQRAQASLLKLGSGATEGLHAIAPDALLWLLPVTDGVREAAVLSPIAWFDAVLRQCRDADSFEWPQRMEPVFGPADQCALGVVPGIAALRARQHSALGSTAWLLPALTLLLVFAFALAFVQQRRAAQRESQAMAAQAQFLTTVTHELKTPLAGIRLLGEMLAEGRAVGKEQDYYRLLVGESARLSLLIDNVLDLGRLERGQRSYSLASWPLGDVLRETLRMFAPVLAQSGIAVTFDDALQDACATMDRDALVQSLVAVLDNARKYGASGKRVEVAGKVAGERLLLTVRDFGPGVPADERQAIFDRFVRGREHLHGSTPGVGIGLYLARSIVRRLGGELTCVSPASGLGVEFQFWLRRGDPT